MKRILFVVGSGIGNQAETIPALVLAKKTYGDRIDVVNSFPYAFGITKILFDGMVENIMLVQDVQKENYESQICTYLAHDFPIKGIPHIVREQPVADKRSEVEHNLFVTGAAYTDADFAESGGALKNISPASGVPDVLIHNGYNKVKVGDPDKWKAKSYARWPEVIEKLKAIGLTVGCIGTVDEAIPNCDNLCGTSFDQTVSAMKGCKMLLSNDTGTFHVANLINLPNIPIFTFTSQKKNFDSRFHRFSKLIASDLPCAPCQHNGTRHYWLVNRNKCHWACRNIEPDRIMKAVKEILS